MRQFTNWREAYNLAMQRAPRSASPRELDILALGFLAGLKASFGANLQPFDEWAINNEADRITVKLGGEINPLTCLVYT